MYLFSPKATNSIPDLHSSTDISPVGDWMPGLTPIPMWLIRSRWPVCVPTKSVKDLRAVGCRNVRNTTVDKGKSQILYISPPSKTNGALNGGFRHGKRDRTEWQIQNGTIAEAAIVLEYGSAAKLTLQATTIGRSYVQTLPFSMICLTDRTRSSNSIMSTLIAFSIVL